MAPLTLHEMNRTASATMKRTTVLRSISWPSKTLKNPLHSVWGTDNSISRFFLVSHNHHPWIKLGGKCQFPCTLNSVIKNTFVLRLTSWPAFFIAERGWVSTALVGLCWFHPELRYESNVRTRSIRDAAYFFLRQDCWNCSTSLSDRYGNREKRLSFPLGDPGRNMVDLTSGAKLNVERNWIQATFYKVLMQFDVGGAETNSWAIMLSDGATHFAKIDGRRTIDCNEEKGMGRMVEYYLCNDQIFSWHMHAVILS